MTPQPTDHELAEFVAGLLKFRLKDGVWHRLENLVGLLPKVLISLDHAYGTFFDSREHSIITRHLIEEEMERRNIRWTFASTSYDGELTYVCDFYGNYTQDDISGEAHDKNKTRAVALAAFKTGER